MVYFQEIKESSHTLKISHGFTMFQEMKTCHKMDNLFFFLAFPPWTTSFTIKFRADLHETFHFFGVGYHY
jgi:hypothetical protein